MKPTETTVHIKDFRAIKDANLKLDGLTVLSGINGSGKSTIAKTLYYAIKTGLNYDEILDRLLLRKIENGLQFFSFLMLDLSHSMESAKLIEKKSYTRVDFSDLEGQEELFELITKQLGILEDFSKLVESLPERQRKSVLPGLISRVNLELIRLKQDLDRAFDDSERTARIGYSREIETSLSKLPQSDLNTAILATLRDVFEKNESKKERRAFSEFKVLCARVLNVEIPRKFSYKEGEIEIFDIDEDRVRPIQEVEDVLYVDTPWIIDFQRKDFLDGSLHSHWKDVLDRLYEPDHSEDETIFTQRIAKTIKGHASRSKEDSRLYFDREDDKHFPLREAATGIKSFSIIQRLAKARSLTDKTLLILDEPESHLHPQWIVEYARILVLMQKELGVKILIASHSPDMIEALQTFSQSAGIAEKTNFYLADETAPGSFDYEFQPQHNSIAKIFKTFNIATARISDYEKDFN